MTKTAEQKRFMKIIVLLFVAVLSFHVLFVGSLILFSNQQNLTIDQDPAPTPKLTPPSTSTPAPTAAPTSTPTIYSNTPNLGGYSDSACTQSVMSMDLGTISPGGYVTKTFYVKNNGNIDLTLSLQTTNWNPTNANGPVTVTWNLDGTVLSANQTSVATLKVHVSPDIEGITTFSLDMVISGTE